MRRDFFPLEIFLLNTAAISKLVRPSSIPALGRRATDVSLSLILSTNHPQYSGTSEGWPGTEENGTLHKETDGFRTTIPIRLARVSINQLRRSETSFRTTNSSFTSETTPRITATNLHPMRKKGKMSKKNAELISQSPNESRFCEHAAAPGRLGKNKNIS